MLRQFRNYGSEKIIFLPGLNVIYGKNASGKSNILEAIYLLAKAKSLRTSNIKEIVEWEKEGFFIQGVFNTGFGDKEISIKYADGKKTLKVNGKEVDKLFEIVSQIPVILFVPDDLRLIKAEPEQRRRFLNSILVQIDQGYMVDLLNYNKVLAERNQALKQIRAGELGNDGLVPWTSELVCTGTRIIRARKKCVAELDLVLDEVSALFGKAGFDIDIAYKSVLDNDGPEESEEDMGRRFHEMIEKKKHAELALCQTLVGPHRDDLDILGDGRALRAYGSQGQQRKAVLGLKTASVLLLKKYFKEWPVTLFDDVLSELDEDNQKAFEDILISLSRRDPVSGMNSWQCFITTADRLDRWDFKDINVVKIEQGKVCV